MIVKEYANESGHWYDLQGQPAYTIIGKNGKERPTTLRDAKKHNLVPSVTTIINLIAKPALDTWKQQQVLMAALTLPRQKGESESSWIDRIILDSKETAKAASERGTIIHGQIEKYFKNPYSNPEPYVLKTKQAVDEAFPDREWLNEKSFAHHLGFGGKVDIHCKDVILDFKTTEKDLNDIKPFPEQIMQLAAYRIGLNIPEAKVGNVYVNNIQNTVKIVIHDEEEVKHKAECFLDLLLFYKLKNKLLD